MGNNRWQRIKRRLQKKHKIGPLPVQNEMEAAPPVVRTPAQLDALFTGNALPKPPTHEEAVAASPPLSFDIVEDATDVDIKKQVKGDGDHTATTRSPSPPLKVEDIEDGEEIENLPDIPGTCSYTTGYTIYNGFSLKKPLQAARLQAKMETARARRQLIEAELKIMLAERLDSQYIQPPPLPPITS